MSIADKLTASKNGLDSLLAYANQTTGQSDTDLGAAIRTLCNGFGQGGSGVVTGEVSVEEDTDTLVIDTGKSDADNIAVFLASTTTVNCAFGWLYTDVFSAALFKKSIAANPAFNVWYAKKNLLNGKISLSNGVFTLHPYVASYKVISGVIYRYIAW